MSTLLSSIVVHGHLPQSMNESVIVPIIKDKNKRINDKNNYRPICLSNVCSKIIEVVIFNRISTFLESSSNQFGLNLNTELNCVYLHSKSCYAFTKNMVLPCTSPFWMPRRLLTG